MLNCLFAKMPSESIDRASCMLASSHCLSKFLRNGLILRNIPSNSLWLLRWMKISIKQQHRGLLAVPTAEVLMLLMMILSYSSLIYSSYHYEHIRWWCSFSLLLLLRNICVWATETQWTMKALTVSWDSSLEEPDWTKMEEKSHLNLSIFWIIKISFSLSLLFFAHCDRFYKRVETSICINWAAMSSLYHGMLHLPMKKKRIKTTKKCLSSLLCSAVMLLVLGSLNFSSFDSRINWPKSPFTRISNVTVRIGRSLVSKRCAMANVAVDRIDKTDDEEEEKKSSFAQHLMRHSASSHAIYD